MYLQGSIHDSCEILAFSSAWVDVLIIFFGGGRGNEAKFLHQYRTKKRPYFSVQRLRPSNLYQLTVLERPYIVFYINRKCQILYWESGNTTRKKRFTSNLPNEIITGNPKIATIQKYGSLGVPGESKFRWWCYCRESWIGICSYPSSLATSVCEL